VRAIVRGAIFAAGVPDRSASEWGRTAQALGTEQTLATEFLARNARGVFAATAVAEKERPRKAAG